MMQELNIEPSFSKIEELAKKEGVEVELLLERVEKFSTSFQKGSPEKFDSSQSHCAGFRVIAGGFEGYAYSENLSDESLAEAYREALKNAKFTAQGADEKRKVELIPNQSSVKEDPKLFNDSLKEIDVPLKLDRARILEKAALDADPRISSVPYNGYTEAESEFQILNSRGVRRRQRSTSVFGYAYCLAKDGEETRMAGEGYFTREAGRFEPKEIAEIAAKKAVKKLGATPPETGKYPVVIDAEVAAEFFGLMTDYFSAKSVYQKTSLFADDIGKSVASSAIKIVDDPFLTGGTGSRTFDSEGVPSQRTEIIAGGKLKSFLTNSVYAKRMGLPVTANASRSARSELDIDVSNLVIEPGKRDLKDLLAAEKRVIYITDFTGYHSGFQAGSGDFSFQSEGELWENGAFVRPLCNFVTSGNIKQVLMDIVEVSSRVPRVTGSILSPDLLVRELSIAGK
jgi:PmbA protein